MISYHHKSREQIVGAALLSWQNSDEHLFTQLMPIETVCVHWGEVIAAYRRSTARTTTVVELKLKMHYIIPLNYIQAIMQFYAKEILQLKS